MFAVVDKPRSPKEYNGLLGIVEADAAIKPLRRPLDKLVADGSKACRSTPLAHGEFGAFLLHKHWEVRERECMIERPAAHPSGKPALITSAQRFPEAFTVAPSRFKVDLQRRELLALEFSSDQAVVQVWHALIAHPTFLEGVCCLVGDSGLADQIGLATFARAAVPVVEGENMVEENWNQTSVLSAQVLNDEDGRIVVTTGWSFVSDSEADLAASSCIAYCMGAGGSHCSHHYARPMLMAPPPVCTLHD